MRDLGCDIVIIGGGIAGLTAGLYTSRAGMDTLLLEGTNLGGQAIIAEAIENFPGFPDGISGIELITRLKEQAVKFGLKIEYEKVAKIVTEEGKSKSVKTNDKTINCYGIILAVGASPKRLGVEGEERFIGRGVSYCATCDGPMYKNKEVVVVGGGDAAIEEALFLDELCKKIYLVHRRDSLRATKVLQERLFKSPRIEFISSSIVKEIKGSNRIEEVVLENLKDHKVYILKTDGIFIFVGTEPNTDFLKGVVDLDTEGYIITNEEMEASVKGIYACGDARKKVFRQLVTAAGEAATAAYICTHYVLSLKGFIYK
ncbi:MAG: thioredoxin-disulfide reductase [Candidatus Omnitrophica bacterium]|nr:thioredoxin-disulfide reductase [Candidatus Omnitrophota bacterium]